MKKIQHAWVKKGIEATFACRVNMDLVTLRYYGGPLQVSIEFQFISRFLMELVNLWVCKQNKNMGSMSCRGFIYPECCRSSSSFKENVTLVVKGLSLLSVD